ncbi:MAG: TetR/AcrR family transcriptional regulator [Treponema sp.]|jgi:AcrR family transcriptional regulator|nr:TetR/AcrR family transcriptional regulator [Treponema sp.]
MNESKARIIKKAVELFKAEGYDQVSIDRLCKACGITKGTFYYHFSAKDEIIFHYYDELSSKLMDVMPRVVQQASYKDKLWVFIEYWIDNTISLGPGLLKAFMIADAEKGLRCFSPICYRPGEAKSFYDMEIELVKQGQSQSTIKKGIAPELLIQTYVSALIGIALDWSSNNGAYDEKEELKKVFDVVFAP